MPELGLREGELAAIAETLGRNPRVLSAAVFGSRAVGRHRPHSDVDIALYGDLSALDVEGVICDLDELPLVCKFDVVAYGLLDSPALRGHIDSAGIGIFDRGAHGQRRAVPG
jgi:predicted nucleotidyltransferase